MCVCVCVCVCVFVCVQLVGTVFGSPFCCQAPYVGFALLHGVVCCLCLWCCVFSVAFNPVGRSSPGPIASATTSPPVPPTRIDAPVCVSTTASTVTLAWNRTVQEGGAPVWYNVYLANSSATPMGAADAPVLATSTLPGGAPNATVTGLLALRSYQFAVQAVNVAGGANVSDVGGWCTTGPPVVPSRMPVPVAVAASVGPDRVNVTWVPPADLGGAPVLRYFIHGVASTGSFAGSSRVVAVDVTATAATSVIVTRLWASTTCVRLRGSGSMWSHGWLLLRVVVVCCGGSSLHVVPSRTPALLISCGVCLFVCAALLGLLWCDQVRVQCPRRKRCR